MSERAEKGRGDRGWRGDALRGPEGEERGRQWTREGDRTVGNRESAPLPGTRKRVRGSGYATMRGKGGREERRGRKKEGKKRRGKEGGREGKEREREGKKERKGEGREGRREMGGEGK